MLDRLGRIEKRYKELNRQMALPEITSDLKQLQTLAQERAGIADLVARYREYKATSKSLEETRAMLNDGPDEEMTTLVKQEIEKLESQQNRLLNELKLGLLPSDANDDKDIIMEIRAVI